MTDRGALTLWRRHREGPVRTRTEIDRPRRTHQLETAEGVTCQDTERNRPSEAHSQAGDGMGRDLSGHRKKSTERGILTNWRRHREGFVRTRKETDRARRAHSLETAGEPCQDTERDRSAEEHSLPGDGIGRDLSGHRKKSTDRGALTPWKQHREGPVRTRTEIDRPRRTHQLETAEGVTCQDTERNRPTEAHSLPADGRQRDLSGHRKKSTDRGALTFWRWHREGLVRTQKETSRQRRTHFLETAPGGTCQDTERN